MSTAARVTSTVVCVAVGASLNACGPANSTEAAARVFDPCGSAIQVGESMNSGERAAVSDALALWNRAANLRLSLLEQPAALASEHSAIEVQFQQAAGAFRGLYDDQRGVVFVNSQLSQQRARTVTIAHELGHAFGLTHVSAQSRRSLMNPGNTEVTPTGHDVATLRQLWGECPEP